jgi:outer membrane lipoprotein-sorting protein
MLRRTFAIFILVTLAVSLVLAADTQSVRTRLSAAQIVDKNVAARGGLQAWRAVQTLSLQGKMGAGGNQRPTLAVPTPHSKELANTLPRRSAEEAQLPFLMEMKRPRKVRMELQFKGQTAVQVYDGANGWKLRPFLNRQEVEPFSQEELKIASHQDDLDGPLVDYAAKGSRVDLEGTEKVEGRDNYKLKVTEKTGHTFHMWLDTQTFLETKIEGQPRRLDGTQHPVEVYYRDFRTVDGLQIPFVIETRVLPVGTNALGLRDTPVPSEKIVIDKVVVNPKIEEKLFSKIELPAVSKSK